MLKITSYLFSIFYGLLFGLTITIFHPLQWLAFNLFGLGAHRKVVDVMNFFLLYGLKIVGSSISFNQSSALPDGPLIFVVNHQSHYDVTGIIWFLRHSKPIFVAKSSLAKGIPSISYNLRTSRAALIERKNRSQALTEISKLGKIIQEEKCAAVIFPEGTRSTDGLGKFATMGVQVLVDNAPDALIVPLVVNGTGYMDSFNIYPIRSFVKLSWETLEPIDPKGKDLKILLEQIRTNMQEKLIDYKA